MGSLIYVAPLQACQAYSAFCVVFFRGYSQNFACGKAHLTKMCRSKMAETENEMVFCDGCDVCVHQVCAFLLPMLIFFQEQAISGSALNTFSQACYGILKIPEGEWFCDRCAVKAKQEPCVLCPVYEGAMKRTEQGRWCHCSCAWWIPEVHFKDTIAMRPVMGVPDVPKRRFSLKCIFCETNNGARHSTCAPFLHSTSDSPSPHF